MALALLAKEGILLDYWRGSSRAGMGVEVKRLKVFGIYSCSGGWGGGWGWGGVNVDL